MIPAMLLVGVLSACSPQPAPTAQAASSAKPAPATTNALAGTPMATYGTALNKAKSVQSIVDKQAAEQRKAIDAQTSPSH